MTRWGGIYLICLAVELISFSIQIIAGSAFDQPFWYILQVISFYFLALFWLLFVSEIIGAWKRVKLQIILPVFCMMAAVLIIMLSRWALDPMRIIYGADFTGSLIILPQILGIYGIFFHIVFYGMGIVSILLLIKLLPNSNFKNQRLIIPMLIGTSFIILMDILDRSGFNLFKPVSMIQIGLAIMGISFFFVTIVWRVGGILPISRESVFEGMLDGVIILDYYDKVIDINTPAQKIVGSSKKLAVNQKLAAVWPLGARLILEHPSEILIKEEHKISIEGQEFTFDINISQFIGLNNSSTGRLIVIRNISKPDQMGKALDERSQELRRTNSLISTLALVTANLQPEINISKINEKVGVELKKMGLVYFIAQYDPETDELVITYLSVLPEVIKWVEKIIRNKIFGFHLDKEQFSGLYKKFESREISFSRYDPANTGSGYKKIPLKVMVQAIQLVGLQPEKPALVLPLVTRDHALGVIGVWGSDIRESDIPAFQIFASQIAHVMETALYQEVEIQRSNELVRSNNLVVALSKVTSALGSTSNSDLVLDILGKELKKVGLNCAVVSVDSNSETGTIRYVSTNPKILQKFEKFVGIKLLNYEIPKRFWPDEKIIGQQLPVWYPDAALITRKVLPMISETMGLKLSRLLFKGVDSHLYVLPLISGGQAIGALAIWGFDLKISDSQILGVFSNQVAGIFQRMTNHEHEIQRTRQLTHSNAIIMALSNVAARLDSTLDLPQVFDTLGHELKKVNIHCMVGTLDDSKQTMKVEYLSIMQDMIKMAKKLNYVWKKEILIPRRLWPTEKAVTEKIPFWDTNPIGNVYKLLPYIPKGLFLKTFKMAGMNPDDPVCYLPLISEEEVIGVLSLWGPELENDDLKGFSIFANQLSIAIKNTRLYKIAQNEIIERTLAENQIREALSEKEVLLKEVHHRVKNNLQVISSLLNLQAAEVSDTKTIEALTESQNRVRSMALIHEKLYQSNDLARIDFAGYLESLVSSLSQTYRVNSKKVSLKVHSDNITLNIDSAIPCGLIINELVSNSLKYAFPADSSGKVEIICKRSQGNRCTLIVADDGVGLPAGFNFDESSSLGLKLVTSLIKQVNGALVIDRKHGIRYEIYFKIK